MAARVLADEIIDALLPLAYLIPGHVFLLANFCTKSLDTNPCTKIIIPYVLVHVYVKFIFVHTGEYKVLVRVSAGQRG